LVILLDYGAAYAQQGAYASNMALLELTKKD
jgi:hypothetical protein